MPDVYFENVYGDLPGAWSQGTRLTEPVGNAVPAGHST
jgi:hypothetical protein